MLRVYASGGAGSSAKNHKSSLQSRGRVASNNQVSATSKKSTEGSNDTPSTVVTNKNVPKGLFGNKVVTIEGRYGTERFVKIEKGQHKGKYAMLNGKGQVVDNNGTPARFNGVSVADVSRYSIFTEQGLKAFAKPTK